MRFISLQSTETERMLRRFIKSSRHYLVRHRAQCILLSSQGYAVQELVKIYDVVCDTIYTWFDDWEQHRLVGLYDAPGRGAKSKLKPEHQSIIWHWITTYPKDSNKVLILIETMLGISICKKTLERYIKKYQFTWRRIRQKVKGKPDPIEYKQRKEKLQAYEQQVDKGELGVVYGDQSGFSLTPYVPYAWQEKGKTIEIETAHSKRLNVFGLLNRTANQLTAYTIESPMNSQTIIACIDNFCQKITKKTVLVLDQAPFHTSKKVKEKIKKWGNQGLHIFFLPTYSPHLNPIEILWRFMKYKWVEIDTYLNWETLVQYVEKVIRCYGQKYQINFV